MYMRLPHLYPLLRGRVTIFIMIVLLKIFLLRSFVFPQTTNIQVLLWELASLVIIFGLLELTKPRTTALFWIINLLLSTYFMANVIYYSYFGQLLNFHAILQFRLINELNTSIFDLFSPAYFVFYVDFILLFILQPFISLSKRVLPFSRFEKSPKVTTFFPSLTHRHKTTSAYYHKTILIVILLALFLSLLNIGFYSTKDNRMAMTRDVGLFNAQGYELYKYLSKSNETSLKSEQFNQAAVNQLKQIEPILWPKYFGSASGKNVILVQLESTQNFLIGLSVNNQEITPNLNNLVKQSLYFSHFYSQIGQGNTSDAEFITNTSIYPLQKGGISTDYVDIDYPSLPRLLKAKGYTSFTFHPNDVTFWNRDNLYPALGFDKYFDKDYYRDEDRLGQWGSSDEILFKKALPILIDYRNRNQRFYASLITLTNHHPYVLPQHKKQIMLPSKLEGTTIGNYLSSVNYQDYALGKFINDLKVANLWEDSIFIVFGDHFGVTKVMEREHKDTLTHLLGREHDVIHALNVPLLIRVPGLKPQVIDSPGGQVDLLPTVANLLGVTLGQQITFGQDILNHPQNLLGFRFYHPEGTFITSDLLHMSGSKIGHSLDNRTITRNDEFFLKEEQRIKSLMQLSDGYLQYLDHKENASVLLNQ